MNKHNANTEQTKKNRHNHTILMGVHTYPYIYRNLITSPKTVARRGRGRAIAPPPLLSQILFLQRPGADLNRDCQIQRLEC